MHIQCALAVFFELYASTHQGLLFVFDFDDFLIGLIEFGFEMALGDLNLFEHGVNDCQVIGFGFDTPSGQLSMIGVHHQTESKNFLIKLAIGQ